MPESSVPSKLVRRPHQSAAIEDAGADHYPCGAVAPSKDQGAQCDSNGTDERVDEKHSCLYARTYGAIKPKDLSCPMTNTRGADAFKGSGATSGRSSDIQTQA